MRIKALKTIIALEEHSCDFSIHKLLSVPRSTMWAHIDEIERETGLTLVKRQKQNTTFTPEGEAFVPYAREMCKLLEKGLNSIKKDGNHPIVGELMISTTSAVSTSWLMPSIKEFRNIFPGLRVHIVADDTLSKKTLRASDILLRPVGDLEGFDKYWHLAYHHGLFANKEYLAQMGTPKDPEDLVNHCILGYGEHEFSFFEDVNWPLKGSKYGLPKLKPTLTVNSTKSLFLAAKEGIGICSATLASNLVYESNLVRILPEIHGPTIRTYFCSRQDVSSSKKENILVFNNFFRNYLKTVGIEVEDETE